MRALLLFVPTFVFALLTVVASVWAVGEEGGGSREAVSRNRAATFVAVIAAVLCALSLLVAAALLVLHAWSTGNTD